MLLWALAALSAITALLALLFARRLSRRLEKLTHSYWELRYEQSELRSAIARLGPDPLAEAPPEPGPASVAFVSIASLKRGPTKSD